MRTFLLIFLSVSIAGCGADHEGFVVASVQGKVVCDGRPVANAIVYFTPESKETKSGKQGSGLTDEEGRFTISTYEEDDGAIIGKHKVTVFSSEYEKTLPGTLPGDHTVEVIEGSNEFQLTLTPNGS